MTKINQVKENQQKIEYPGNSGHSLIVNNKSLDFLAIKFLFLHVDPQMRNTVDISSITSTCLYL